MMMMKTNLLRLAALGVLVLALFAASAARAQQDGALKPGDVLDQSNWQKGEGLLPPELLEHYKKGEFVNPVVEWQDGRPWGGQDFRKGSEENRGRLTLDEQGAVVEKATGRQPSYVIGFPFPDIDPKDPQAAIKILWNYYYQWWYNGNVLNRTSVEWVGTGGFERKSIQDVRFLYYDAQRRELSPEENPRNLLQQFLASTVEPIDLYGTTALAWRFRDGDKRDNMWAYVPALRRVRAVSPANRSDGFLGSDLSQDDGPFFDGKPQEFNWKLAGETEMFRFTCPRALRGELTWVKRAEGGWGTQPIPIAYFGYQQPGWKGLPWAPLSLGLAKRKMWIVEGTPKDRYYLYGKIQLYIDKEVFEGTINRKFDWKGELVNVFINGRGTHHSPDGELSFNVGPGSVILAENVRMNRATVVEPGRKNEPFVYYGVHLEPALFEYQALLKVGK